MARREPLDREVAMYHGNDDAAIAWRERTIHDQDIPGVDPGLSHRLPSDPDEERRGGVRDEVRMEIQSAIKRVIGWGRIAG